MSKVQVLLSAYNGAGYIGEQLNSILDQDYQDITILIRDDGSTDGTRRIIKSYAKNSKKIQLYCGNNLGVISSFFWLMEHAGEADYYAFSDQDDVWMEQKISKAVEAIKKAEMSLRGTFPVLYCGNTTLVDENLKPIKDNTIRTTIKPSFGNALVENICTGCTMVINRELLSLVNAHIPEYTVIHDWWMYLTASYSGKVIYDCNSYILYRQHTGNAVGKAKNKIEEFLKRLKRFPNNYHAISRQAQEFMRMYGCRKDAEGRCLKLVANYRKSLKSKAELLATRQIRRQKMMDQIIFKILFFLGLR